MSVNLFFPLWAKNLVFTLLDKHDLNQAFTFHPSQRRMGFIVDENDVVLTSKTGLERDLVYLRVPYDKVCSHLNLLQQIRFLGKRSEAYTRYVEIDQYGLPLPLPSKKFSRRYKSVVQSKKYHQVGAPFDDAIEESELKAALPGLIAGALYNKEDPVISEVTALAKQEEFTFNDALKIKTDTIVRQMFVTRSYEKWLNDVSSVQTQP